MTMETEMMEEWANLAADTSITTEELDEAVKLMRFLETQYKGHKEIATAAHNAYQEAKAKLIHMLQNAGKSKYHVDGHGTASLVTKLKVRTPKDLDSKELLFGYIREHYGEEGVLSYANVNYQSLNSFYNDEFEKAKNEGRADDFSIPGLETPDSEVSLSFRK